MLPATAPKLNVTRDDMIWMSVGLRF